MEEVNHLRIKTNGIWMHVAEQGTGPLVLLLHGFPEIWYSWRHQIPFLAGHGYRVVAPDLRGYGDSDSPLNPSSYSIFHIVGDLVGLIDHFGEQKVFVVGIDTGAVAGWYLSLFRPDRVRALVALGVPFFPRSPVSDVESLRKAFGDGCHVVQFQEPGRAERAFARYDYMTVMKKWVLMTKAESLLAPPDMEMIDYMETPVVPPWITEEELRVFADKFEESGFSGPFNYYRAMDLNWQLLAPWEGAKVNVPVKFIVGNKDPGFQSLGVKEYVEGEVFKSLVPNLEVVIIEGHHFIQQERAQQVSEETLTFLRKCSSDE